MLNDKPHTVWWIAQRMCLFMLKEHTQEQAREVPVHLFNELIHRINRSLLVQPEIHF